MANIFSHPAFVPTGNYSLVGYNLVVSRAVGGGSDSGAPNYFGPWSAVTGYTDYTSNTDIIDVAGTPFDLYRVQPIVSVTPNGQATTQVTLGFSRAFTATQPLYDVQISALLDTFRRNYLHDLPIYHRDSTLPQEATGGAVMPFITDDTTDTFFLSFLQNDDPVKIIPEHTIVWNGASKAAATTPLTHYADFFSSAKDGFIRFKDIPSTNSYLSVEYYTVRSTDDECRSSLINAVSQLSLYGINSFSVQQSNNLFYLGTALPDRDIGEILCLIAYKTLANASVATQAENSEAWKDGKVEWTADPARALQAETMHISNLSEELRHRCNAYIVNTRNYISHGEFDSFFDVSGVLPIYSLMVAGANLGGALGWWL